MVLLMARSKRMRLRIPDWMLLRGESNCNPYKYLKAGRKSHNVDGPPQESTLKLTALSLAGGSGPY